MAKQAPLPSATMSWSRFGVIRNLVRIYEPPIFRAEKNLPFRHHVPSSIQQIVNVTCLYPVALAQAFGSSSRFKSARTNALNKASSFSCLGQTVVGRPVGGLRKEVVPYRIKLGWSRWFQKGSCSLSAT